VLLFWKSQKKRRQNIKDQENAELDVTVKYNIQAYKQRKKNLKMPNTNTQIDEDELLSQSNM